MQNHVTHFRLLFCFDEIDDCHSQKTEQPVSSQKLDITVKYELLYHSLEKLKWYKILWVTIYICYLVCKATLGHGSTSFQFAKKLLQSKERLS